MTDPLNKWSEPVDVAFSHLFPTQSAYIRVNLRLIPLRRSWEPRRAGDERRLRERERETNPLPIASSFPKTDAKARSSGQLHRPEFP